LLKPEDKVIHDYQDVETKIKVTGVPRPTVQWLRNGKQIDTNIMEPNTQTLKNRINTVGDAQLSSDFYVTHFSPSDADTYSCVASNIAGETEIKFRLTVLESAPVFASKFDRFIEIPEGERLELKCKVDGSPLPKVKWILDNDELNANEQ
jgi:Immunoglobulin I-set domain